MTFIRAYLRASTNEQDASRAAGALDRFAADRGFRIAARYVENESGASLKRPELFRLLSDCQPGDVLLVEQVDRLSRLNADDWEKLKTEIAARGVCVVALDLPTSWGMIEGSKTDDVQGRVLAAVNGMMLDMLAAFARKDYEDRRRRQFEGQEKARAEGKYKGRPEDTTRNEEICKRLRAGDSWGKIQALTGCSKALLAKLSARIKGEVANAA